MLSSQSCHNCGKSIQGNASVVRAVKTGVYTGGGDYFRNVNLCPTCAEDQTRLETVQRLRRRLLLLGGVVLLLGVSAYLLFLQ